jgi:hypothetical protein
MFEGRELQVGTTRQNGGCHKQGMPDSFPSLHNISYRT